MYRDKRWYQVVRDVSFSLGASETLALVGESGCGKSLTSLAIMGLLDPLLSRVYGSVEFSGEQLIGIGERRYRALRGRDIAMIFQDPMSALNPTMSIGKQVAEVFRYKQGLSRREAKLNTIALLERCGINQASQRYGQYPFEFSGGMLQRVMIAMAIAAKPKLIIADEPTTALDVTVQQQVLKLLKSLQQEYGLSLLLITHDLGVVAGMADRVAVMYAGSLLELAGIEQLYQGPLHPYTQALLAAVPRIDPDKHRNGSHFGAAIAGALPDLSQLPAGCIYAPRCPKQMKVCQSYQPELNQTELSGQLLRCWNTDELERLYPPSLPQQAGQQQNPNTTGVSCVSTARVSTARVSTARVSTARVSTSPVSTSPVSTSYVRTAYVNAEKTPLAESPLLEVSGLCKSFRLKGRCLPVLKSISFTIQAGEILALVGESGSGKSTVAKCLAGLHDKDAGTVRLKGETLASRYAKKDFLLASHSLQMVFQDSGSALNARLSVLECVAEGLVLAQGGRAEDYREVVLQCLSTVGLDDTYLARYPHQLSGGQRQRIGIARALVLEPALLICDEPVSALDVSVQAQVLLLLRKLAKERNIGILFIGHDLAVVHQLADRVAVMSAGELVEQGTVDQVLLDPQHAYTKALLSAVPEPDQRAQQVFALD
jgi:oligopeptide/dipeptide ABC transporter ATP-binding protein